MKKLRRYYGFTLVEVLVSAAILSIIIGVFLSILSSTLGIWRVTSGQVEVDVEGRAGFLLLMQDIDNVVMPKSVGLYPRVVSRGGVSYLQFLTLKPSDYQSSQDSSQDLGDVCYVEYYLDGGGDPNSSASGGLSLLRTFRPSKWTYENILVSGSFPSSPLGEGQLLSTNVLRDFRDSLRSYPALRGEANTNSFVLLATNNAGQTGTILPISGSPTLTNPPVGVEVNFGITDYQGAGNLDLLNNPQYRLRNGSYFSMRFDFPRPIY